MKNKYSNDKNKISMPQTDKVIEEVEEKFEDDGTGKNTKVCSIFSAISNTNKEVNKFLSRMNCHHNNHPPDLGSKHSTPRKEVSLNRYNYYGKRYRFEEKQQEMRVQPPKIDRSCFTENLFDKDQISVNESRLTVKQKRKRKLQEDQSMFMNQDIKFPSQNYYIYFDKPPETLKHVQSLKKKPKKQLVKKEVKPAWFLERKIQTLQKQVNNLKQHNMSNTGQSFRNSRQFRKSDGPIRLKNNIQRMVQTLWH